MELEGGVRRGDSYASAFSFSGQTVLAALFWNAAPKYLFPERM
jgi:hypothetical protein